TFSALVWQNNTTPSLMEVGVPPTEAIPCFKGTFNFRVRTPTSPDVENLQQGDFPNNRRLPRSLGFDMAALGECRGAVYRDPPPTQPALARNDTVVKLVYNRPNLAPTMKSLSTTTAMMTTTTLCGPVSPSRT
ncbi:MAG: hypothetical protein JW963_05040, partial [Anaerolineales bacterium]|nr:hypothetical protein [Anaerolineales bacterium]